MSSVTMADRWQTDREERDWTLARRTHTPEVLAATRSALQNGLTYDAEVTASVAAALGVDVTRDLGAAVYHAKSAIRDEERRAKLEALQADGWLFVGDVELEDGARYTLRNQTRYVGDAERTYHHPEPVRAAKRGWQGVASGGFVFVGKGKRTSGWRWDPWALIREGWEES